MHHHSQYITDVPAANRPQQQSSPSDDNSMSTATPPHQNSRASPASTALVMSSNNLNGQSTSRQLSPNNTSSSNNGTGSSTNSTTNPAVAGAPPHPMARQFAYHTKSMSAGVVVSVPGISNNLAGPMNPNNHLMGHNIPANQHHRAPQPAEPHTGPMAAHHTRSSSQHHQQVIREHHQAGMASQTQLQHQHHQQQQQQQQQQMHHHHQQQQHQQQQHHQQQQQAHPLYNQNHLGSSNNFINSRQTASSIILSDNNINNLHNRSASTHLSNALLNSQNPHTQSNHHVPQSRNFHFTPHAFNSIWSVDEKMSKSQGKLATGDFITHPYLFNPSMTDMSCDNVSNVSRLIENGPAPAYYLNAPTNIPNSNVLSKGTSPIPEFLPIYDLMFYLTSMIIYFGENIFAVIALIALYYHTGNFYWVLLGASFVMSSNFITQYLSFKWLYKTKLEDCRSKREAQEELEDEENCERRYYNRMASNMRNYQCGSCNWLPDSATEVQLKFLLSILADAILHLFCLGFLIRYIKLVIPVTDTARVKKEARDLCMLRMTHGFIQSAPLLLLQAYMICSQTSSPSITNLIVTSAILSLINVCWTLASFTKYARKKYMHKFVLSWLGIMSQFLWRIGTVSSRVVALTIYAFYYNYWMLVVLSLHWITMFFWLVKPGNLLRDEVNMTRARKILFAMATAWIYCFCYMNFEEHNSKMTIYYLIMFLENNLLLTVCLIFSSQVTWFKNLSILVVYLGFVFGMLFMFLYYKYFHVSVLNNGLSCSQESIDSIANQLSPASKKIAGFKPGTLRLKNEDSLTVGHRYNSNISATLHTGSHPEITRNSQPPYLTAARAQVTLNNGVFDCKPDPNFKKPKIPNSRVRRYN